MLTAVETTGTLTDNHNIELDESLPVGKKSRVRVIVFFDEKDERDLNEKEWAQFLSNNEVFDFLADEVENIYTL